MEDEARVRAFYEERPFGMKPGSASPGIRKLHALFVTRVAALRPERLLDAGCGCAALGRELAPFCGSYHGVDISSAALAAARQTVPYGTFCQGSLCRLPYVDGCFDCVVCEEVLEHVPDCDRAIAELARVTRPGGRVMISTPNPLSPDIAYGFLVRGRCTAQPYELPIRRPRLERRARQAGLRVVEFLSVDHRPPLSRALPETLRKPLMRIQQFASRLSGVPLGVYQFITLAREGGA